MSELQQEGGMSNQKQQIFEQLKEQQQAVKEDRAADIIDLQIAFDPRQSRVSNNVYIVMNKQVCSQSFLKFLGHESVALLL